MILSSNGNNGSSTQRSPHHVLLDSKAYHNARLVSIEGTSFGKECCSVWASGLNNGGRGLQLGALNLEQATAPESLLLPFSLPTRHPKVSTSQRNLPPHVNPAHSNFSRTTPV